MKVLCDREKLREGLAMMAGLFWDLGDREVQKDRVTG